MEALMLEEELEEDLDEEFEEEDDGVFNPDQKYSKMELEEWADKILREDANRELCRVCVDAAKKLRFLPETKPDDVLPYGHETGHVEWQIQFAKDGVTPLLDEEDQVLYVGFPELMCEKGHRWYKGEGPRRDIRGKNAILFETHLYNRRRREIYVKDGVPDPAYTMDRWGKRPTTGIYGRAHPLGRKINTPEQRKKGSSYFRS